MIFNLDNVDTNYDCNECVDSNGHTNMISQMIYINKSATVHVELAVTYAHSGHLEC